MLLSGLPRPVLVGSLTLNEVLQVIPTGSKHAAGQSQLSTPHPQISTYLSPEGNVHCTGDPGTDNGEKHKQDLDRMFLPGSELPEGRPIIKIFLVFTSSLDTKQNKPQKEATSPMK